MPGNAYLWLDKKDIEREILHKIGRHSIFGGYWMKTLKRKNAKQTVFCVGSTDPVSTENMWVSLH